MKKYPVHFKFAVALSFLVSCTLYHKISVLDIDMTSRNEQIYHVNLYTDKYNSVGEKQGPYCLFVKDPAIKSQAAMDSINIHIKNTNMVYGSSTFMVVLSDTTMIVTEAIFRSNYSDAGFDLGCFTVNKNISNWDAEIRIKINAFDPEITSALIGSKLEIRLGKHSWK